MERANHVRIDRVTQGPDGHEIPADRLSVNSEDFLWIYVEAELPDGSSPAGEYARRNADGSLGTQILLAPPVRIGGQYRFALLHYTLAYPATYLFHFADNLSRPNFEDSWEIRTVS